LLGLCLTYVSLNGDTPSAVARWAAVGTGISLALSMLIELNRRWENLLRADVVALAALYFLIFVEFLFPQKLFDDLIGAPQQIEPGIGICLLAFAALGIGRHCVRERVRTWGVLDTQIPLSIVSLMFWISFAIGYFHMLLAVDFNPITMVNDFFLPRFEQPWARTKYGDLYAMLYELGATLYLVPPLAGIILGRPRKRWNLNVILVLLGLLLTLFYGFTTGTRNIICAYMVTFVVSYFYASSASKWKIAVLGAMAAGVLALSTFYGIRFRNCGLRDYLAGATNEEADVKDSLYVDYNLYAVSQLVTVFPNYVDYIGWDGPIWLLVRPVPRFLWQNKPLGESVTPESALGSEGATISCTFIGESYMVAGVTGVIVTAFGLGMLARWWTKKVFSKHSDLGILIYGSGFFAIAITMRSIYMLPVAILPTIFAAIIGYWLTRRLQRRRQRRMQASQPLPRFKLDEAQA